MPSFPLDFRAAALLGCSGAVFSALSLLSPSPAAPPVPVAVEVASEELPPDAPIAYERATGRTWAGEASFYAASLDGRLTASGAPYDHGGLTAAHRTLPFGTRLLVRNERNGRRVVVTVNDRGPFVRGRAIDLSGAAARTLGMVQAGLVPVTFSELDGDLERDVEGAHGVR